MKPCTVEQIQAMAAAGHPFWSQVAVSDRGSCWPWRGATDKNGYGYEGRERTHRIAWECHTRKSLASGEVVRHTCDNPPCCNPLHLVAGTQDENVRDMVDKGRSARGTFNGRSKLSNADVLAIYRAAGSYDEIGGRFGVSKWSVRDIKTGRNWGWLTGAISRDTPEISRRAQSCSTGDT